LFGSNSATLSAGGLRGARNGFRFLEHLAVASSLFR
jgi:hypothetical protein